MARGRPPKNALKAPLSGARELPSGYRHEAEGDRMDAVTDPR